MKNKLPVWCMLLVLGAGVSAAPITGRVFDKASGKGLPGILVSDGNNIVKTGQDGKYTLETTGRRAYVMIHEIETVRAERRFLKLEKGRTEYDFPVRIVPAQNEVLFMHFGDPETQNMKLWKDDIVALGKNLKIDFMVNGGDLCNLHGMTAHAANFKEKELPFELFYVVGNHDINKSDPSAYEKIIGPYWYSFERGGVIFLAAPVHYGDIGVLRGSTPSKYQRPYTLEEFGTYLEKLLALLPREQPKVVLVHGVSGGSTFDLKFPTEAGKTVRLNDYALRGAVMAHSHHNLVMHGPGNYFVYRTSHPNMSGEDWNPAAVRLIRYDRKTRTWSSFLVWSGQHERLSLQTANADGAVTLSAVAYDSADPVKQLTLRLDCKELAPARASALAWCAQAELPPGEYRGVLTAKTVSGKEFSKDVTFRIAPPRPAAEVTETWENFLGNAEHNGFYPVQESGPYRKLAFIAHTKGEILMASPVVTGGKVFTATIDNGDGEHCGLHAFDAKSGKLIWSRKTDFSVPNSLAAGGGMVFTQDLRGRVCSYDADSGKLIWTEHTPCADYRVMIAGLVYSKGKVFAGSRDTLHAIDAKTGRVIWKNPVKSSDTGSVNTITVGGGTVCTATAGEGVYGFDENDGKLLWKKEKGEFGGQSASAVYADGKFYLKGTKTVFVLEPRSGKVLAERDLGERLYSSVMPLLITDRLIVAGARDGRLHALDKNTLKTVWTLPLSDHALMKSGPYNPWNRVKGCIASGAVIRGERMYLTHTDGFLYIINVNTGKTEHKIEIGMPGFCAPAFADGGLFVTDFAGRVFRFDREDGTAPGGGAGTL